MHTCGGPLTTNGDLDNLIFGGNALLPLLRAQCPQPWQSWLDSDVVTLELRLNCGQDKDSTASLYAIELHVRIGHLDTLDEEEELPWDGEGVVDEEEEDDEEQEEDEQWPGGTDENMGGRASSYGVYDDDDDDDELAADWDNSQGSTQGALPAVSEVRSKRKRA